LPVIDTSLLPLEWREGSGLVGRKIAATLASTGTPSFFLHPGEAFHGDLGMISKDDVVLALWHRRNCHPRSPSCA